MLKRSLFSARRNLVDAGSEVMACRVLAGLVVAALISDPVSASFSQGGAGSSAPDLLGVLVSISVIIGGY